MRESTAVENGDCLSKLPPATAEQLNIVRILSKPGDDVDLRRLVAQLKELTSCNEDQAVTALYDCENDLERAVELLLDRFRSGADEEWHTTGKKLRAKHATEDHETSSHCHSLDGEVENERLNRSKVSSDSSGKNDSGLGYQSHPDKVSASAQSPGVQHDFSDTQSKKKDARGKMGISSPHASRTPVELGKGNSGLGPRSDPVRGSSFKRHLTQSKSTDGWDPYTEYGEWGGEAIEVVNSKASIACDFREDSSLPDGLFVDTDNPSVKTVDSLHSGESMAHSPDSDLSSKLSSLTDKESIFVSKASSKAPPPGFSSLPDAPVFIAPDLIVRASTQWKYKFGDVCSPILPSTPGVPITPRALRPPVSQTSQGNLLCTASSRPDLDSQMFSPYVSSPPSKLSNTNFTLDKSTTRGLLENPPMENNTVISNTQYPEHFSSENLPTKSPATFPTSQNSQPASAGTFGTENGTGKSGFLESSLKNYMLDNLPGEMNKLSGGDSSQNSKQVQHNLQTSTAQAQPIGSSFTHNQVHAPIQHHLPKGAIPHIPLHTSQQPLVSNPSQPHQQAAALPPGMPHFISQFAPPAYHMFNLPGGSGNAPIFDLEQLQLLQQQQRLFYDMHLQHQAATTAQSLLSSSEACSTSKSNHITGPLGHVTAANPAMRSDILAPAIGHAPQMMPPGHSYFSYPGFVVMNGYTNAFLNQQQSSQDGQVQTTGHSGSPLGQQQSQPTSSTQPYGGMKSVNTVVSYDDIFELKYGDPSKQVGYKTNSHLPSGYGSYQPHVPSTDGVGNKISASGHPVGGVLTQGFNPNTSGIGNSGPQQFSPSFYPPAAAPYLSAAVAVAAAAAASAQQQQQQQPMTGGASANSAGQPNTVGGGNQVGQGVTGPNQMHLSTNPGQPLVMGNTGPGLHHVHHQHHAHQRSVIPH